MTTRGKILVFLLLVGLAPVYGWTTATLWSWFLVPLGLPAISIWHAYGIGTLTMFLVPPAVKAPGDTDWPIVIGQAVSRPILALAIGALMRGAMLLWG